MDPKDENQAPERDESSASQRDSDVLRPLRTFKDDVARALGRGASAVSIAASEEKRRGERRELTEHERELEERIQEEGAKIRTLTSKLEKERAEWSKQRDKEQMAQLRDRYAPQKEKAAPERTYEPPPGIPRKMVADRTPSTEAKQPPPPERSKERTELQAAKDRLAKAKEELDKTKQEHVARMPKQLHPTPRERRPFVKPLITAAASVVLIAATGGVGYFIYQNFSTLGTVRPESQVPTLVPVNAQVAVPFNTNESLRDTLAEAMRQRSGGPGDVTQFYVVTGGAGVETLVSAETLLESIAPRVPGQLSRSLGNPYTLGTHMLEGPEAFLVARTTFFENAFAGMLAWESTMRADLAPLFGDAHTTTIGPSAGQEDTTTEALGAPRFVDRVIQNKDVRVLLDANENVVLLYSFVDRNTLILTTNVETFLEIFGRIASERVVR